MKINQVYYNYNNIIDIKEYDNNDNDEMIEEENDEDHKSNLKFNY